MSEADDATRTIVDVDVTAEDALEATHSEARPNFTDEPLLDGGFAPSPSSLGGGHSSSSAGE